jgi:hypothetical protein
MSTCNLTLQKISPLIVNSLKRRPKALPITIHPCSRLQFSIANIMGFDTGGKEEGEEGVGEGREREEAAQVESSSSPSSSEMPQERSSL